MAKKEKATPAAAAAAPTASPVASRVADEDDEDRHSRSSYSDGSSAASSPSQRNAHQQRPRFDSKASWADSTRFDMGRADSRASEISARDLRLTSLSRSNRHRSDSRASSRASKSGRAQTRGRNSSFVSNFGVTKARKDSNALSTITENWNLADDQFGSPFSDFNAQGGRMCFMRYMSHSCCG